MQHVYDPPPPPPQTQGVYAALFSDYICMCSTGRIKVWKAAARPQFRCE
jgi:hypothetical protein